ncbi:MAG: hypothetical protein SGILL_009358, partial [Bacillariaceae sp.]
FAEGNEVLFLGAESDEVVQEAVSCTIDLWTAMYPDESFHLDMRFNESNEQSQDRSVADTNSSDSDLLLNGFDLLLSTDRQATFLWQVSAPNFSKQRFLHEGLENYQKFLHLKGENDGSMIIVPTYQIDLFWHTHMLSSICGYYADCKAIIGSAMHHDDSLNDRTEGGTLDTAFTATKAAWKELYGEEFKVEGGMYRGEPPMLYYNPSFVLESTMLNSLSNMKPPPNHPFNKFIDVQGASSTNPGAYDMAIIWCWKETKSQMSLHTAFEIVGDPSKCWIRYSSHDNETLEAAFQQSGGNQTVIIGNGAYKVNFSTMQQTKVKTGFERKVKRFVQTSGADGVTTTVGTSTVATAPSSKSNAVPLATPVVEWTKPSGCTADGVQGFVARNARSTQKGVNANPQKPAYIFGNGECGVGYYHVTTRSAYQILEKRIQVRMKKIEDDIAVAQCCQCGNSNYENRYIIRKERELNELTEYHAIVKARARADVPVGKIGIPANLVAAAGPNQAPNTGANRNNRRDDYYYTDTGIWLFPPVFYDSGGGCGTIGHHAGGCGGKQAAYALFSCVPEHVVLLHVEPVLAAVAEEAVEVAAVEVAAVEVEDVVVEASSIEVAVASLQYSACITGPDPLTVPDCFGISHFFRRLWWQEAEMDHVEAENCAMDQL